jgi:hypothetical protein
MDKTSQELALRRSVLLEDELGTILENTTERTDRPTTSGKCI